MLKELELEVKINSLYQRKESSVTALKTIVINQKNTIKRLTAMQYFWIIYVAVNHQLVASQQIMPGSFMY